MKIIVFVHRHYFIFALLFQIAVTLSLISSNTIMIGHQFVTAEHLSLGLGDLLSHLGLDARKPVFSVCKQQGRRPACASTQADQRLCFSLIGKYHI